MMEEDKRLSLEAPVTPPQVSDSRSYPSRFSAPLGQPTWSSPEPLPSSISTSSRSNQDSSFLLSPVAVSSPSPSPITLAIELTPCRVCHRCSCVIRLSLNPGRHHASNANSCTGQPPDTHSEHPEHATLLATSARRPPIALTVLTVTDLLPLRIHEKPLIIFT